MLFSIHLKAQHAQITWLHTEAFKDIPVQLIGQPSKAKSSQAKPIKKNKHIWIAKFLFGHNNLIID